MPLIQLFMANSALREALTEQLQDGALCKADAGGDLAASLQSDAVMLLMLDEEAADKKSAKLIADAQAGGNKKRIFFLGKPGQDWDNVNFAEIFAKPVRLGHLLARLQFYLEAAPRMDNADILFGPYCFEPGNRRVLRKDTQDIIRLTEKETALLEQLAQSEAPVAREDLLVRVWGYGDGVDTHTLETHIYQLRRKLDPQGLGTNWLVNEQGAYRLNREATA